MLGKIFVELFNMSLTAGVVIAAVLLLRLLLRRAPKIFSYCLWAAVLFRLLCPISFQTPVSLLGTLGVEANREGGVVYFQELGERFASEEVSGLEELSGQMRTETEEAWPGQPGERETGKRSETFGDDGIGVTAVWPAVSGQSGNEDGGLLAFLWPESFSLVMRIGLLLWLAGILGLVLYGVVSAARLRLSLRSAEEEIQEGNIGVYHSDQVAMPFVLGLVRPRIYLPRHLGKQEKAYILMHERIHIRRGDPIFRLLAYGALCLHWFNPLVWLAFFLSERDMEMSCDEAVIRRFGNQAKKEYTTSLLSLATGRRGVSKISLAFAEGDTGSRIRNVLRYRKPAAPLMGLGVGLALLAAFFLIGNPVGASPAEPSADAGASLADGDAGAEENGAGAEQEKGAEPGESAEVPDISPDAAACVYGVLADVSDWREKADGSRYQTFLFKTAAEPYFVTIDEDTRIEPYFEFDMSQGLKDGDLVRLFFPEGEKTLSEGYPRQFQADPEAVEVLGRRYGLEYLGEEDGIRVSMPLGRAPDAAQGTRLDLLFRTIVVDDQEGGQMEIQTSLKKVPVVEVNPRYQELWLELTASQAALYLEQIAFGTVQVREAEEEKVETVMTDVTPGRAVQVTEELWEPVEKLQVLDAEALEEGKVADGEYLAYVSLGDGQEEVVKLSDLQFSSVCSYWVVSEEAGEARYVSRDFQDFSISVEKAAETVDSDAPLLRLSFYKGQVVEASLLESLQASSKR